MNYFEKRKVATLLFSMFTMLISCRMDYINDQQKHVYSPGNYEESGSIEINPETIISSLENNDKSVFISLVSTPEAYTRLPAGSFVWTQADYLNISTAMFQHIWKETPDDWLLYQMHFVKRSCKDNTHGFDLARVVYFKQINVSNNEVYTVRDILIMPLIKTVLWGKSWDYTPTHKWEYIDFENLKMTADDALMLAENNGGKATHLNNKCDISINLVPEGEYSDWKISYTDDNAYSLFSMTVDPYDGSYEVVDE